LCDWLSSDDDNGMLATKDTMGTKALAGRLVGLLRRPTGRGPATETASLAYKWGLLFRSRVHAGPRCGPTDRRFVLFVFFVAQTFLLFVAY